MSSIRYVKRRPPTPPPRLSNASSVPALLSTLPLLYVHYNLLPTRPDELALRVGDVVNIEAAFADGWGYGQLIKFDSDTINNRHYQNERGWVPICYLREEEPEILDSADEMDGDSYRGSIDEEMEGSDTEMPESDKIPEVVHGGEEEF